MDYISCNIIKSNQILFFFCFFNRYKLSSRFLYASRFECRNLENRTIPILYVFFSFSNRFCCRLPNTAETNMNVKKSYLHLLIQMVKYLKPRSRFSELKSILYKDFHTSILSATILIDRSFTRTSYGK
jgi:hypothetical protein